MPKTKTEKYAKLYVALLAITGLTISLFIYKLMGATEQSAYQAEAKVEANSLAMSLDLIMANHAIKMRNFEDHININRIKSSRNRQVIQSAFSHSIFSSFSFLKYRSTESSFRVKSFERLYHVVAPDKEVLPFYDESLLHSDIAKITVEQLVKSGEKQSQFLVDVKGEVLYVVISRSVVKANLFFAFSGFAKNLLKDNFPTKTNIEGVIYQRSDNTYWHVVKEDKNITFKKILSPAMHSVFKEKIVFPYAARFGAGKYFDIQVLVPNSSPQKNMFAIFVFMSGLVITLLLGFLLHYLITRNIRIHNIVKERTFELEQESKKSKEAAVAKSRFLANISHEIRTPLNIVLGMSDLLSETPLTSMQKHYLDSINNSGQHLLNLINDILDMTHVDVSEVPFKVEKVKLLKVFEESCLAVDELARNKNLDLYMNLDPSLPDHVEIDSSRVRQILINLLSNAVKYTEKGFIEFSAAGKTHKETGGYLLEFRIRDSGIGISEVDKQEIFKAFYQVNSSIQRAQGGVGLGLSIVASIVKRLGGHVDVQSTLGIGSTFIVTIPLVEFSKESWSAQLADATAPSKNSIFISSDTMLTRTFDKYMKSIKQPLTTINSLQKLHIEPLRGDTIDCMFVDMDTVADFNKEMLGDLNYEKIILMGEPSENPRTISIKQFNNMVLWPNKLLLPSQISTAIGQKSESAMVSQETAGKQNSCRGRAEDLNILIVDDDTSNKLLFEAYCSNRSWNVNFASNGQDAIDNHLRRMQFDILITDLQMPIMDGFTLLQRVNSKEGSILKPNYTIVISADSTEEAISISKSLDVDHFLAKPIRKADFLRAVEQVQSIYC